MRGLIPAIVICAAVSTAACGVKGPLYYPGVPRDAPWPYAKPKPAAPSPPSASPAAGPAPDAQPEATPAAPATAPEPASEPKP